MNKDLIIILNLYVVPLIAVLLSYFGILQGGTGFAVLDLIIYNISFTLVYAITYFFLNYFQSRLKSITSTVIYLILIILFTYTVSTILIVLLIITFGHLLLITKKATHEINFDNSILSFVIKSLPKENWIVIIIYISLTFIIY
jgi:hypothetical protein